MKFRRLLVGSALALAFLFIMIRCSIHTVSHNYNLAAEANGLYGILSLDSGHPLYPARTEKPYFVYVYPPLHAWLSASLLKIAPHASVHTKVVIVRLLSLVSFLLALGILWSNVLKNFSIPRYAFLILCVLGLSKFFDYATTTRNDMFYLLLNTLSLTCFLAYWRDQKKKWALAAFVFVCWLSFMTRPTGVTLFAAVWLFLLTHRQWKSWLTLSVIFPTLCLSFVWAINRQTHGAFIEHVFLANIRSYRPVDHYLFDRSFLSFLASYLLFTLLAIAGLRHSVRDQRASSEQRAEFQLLTLVAGTSFAFASLVFLRAGGDVNYFFDTIFFLLGFAALALHRMWPKSFTAPAIAVQCLIIAAVLGVKARSAYRVAFIPYEQIAEKLKSMNPPYGELSGYHAANLAVHLMGWAYHGPDVTTGALVAQNSHPSLHWILDDLKAASKSGEIHSFVYAEPDCEHWTDVPPDPPFEAFTKRIIVEPWVCVYENKVAEVGLLVGGVRP